MKPHVKTQGSFADRINQQNAKNEQKWVLCAIAVLALVLTACIAVSWSARSSNRDKIPTQEVFVTGAEITPNDVSGYSGSPYVIINNNVPNLEVENSEQEFEYYSDLDSLGRCGPAFANISKALMPTDERESISEVIPSGWQNQKYEGIDQEYLYNRCHLIGFQLSGENANEKNLITGTRYMNTEGMLPFENTVREYVIKTNNHVLYRVTPIFEGENLVASGVVMEALSVEDSGQGISFFVYVYNIQPGIIINYATGESSEM